MATYPATNSKEASELLIDGSNQVHEVVNGDATTEVTTESGPIPSLRKAISDTFLFQDPIAWSQGSDETAFNQLRTFDGNIYWAPTATLSSPIPMGATPIGDNNWKLAPVDVNREWTLDEITTAQNNIIGGSIFKGSNGVTVEVGDEIPINTTHIRMSVGGNELLVKAWGNLTLPAAVTAVPTTDNGFGGYDLATDQGTFEFVTEDKQRLREANDILGWFSEDVFDGTTDITSNILAAKTYVEGTNSRDIICSKGNAFINGTIELDNDVNVSFGDNKVIAGPSMQWIVRKGSNIVINDVRLGEDGKTQNLQPLFLVNSEAGPIFLDGQRDTSVNCGVKSEITTGAPFVRLEAKVKPGQSESSAVTGVDVEIKTNQGRRAVEINADNY